MGGEVELTRFLLRPAPPFSKLAFILLLVPPGIQCLGLEQADLPPWPFFLLAHALCRMSKQAKQASKPRPPAGYLLPPSQCMMYALYFMYTLLGYVCVDVYVCVR